MSVYVDDLMKWPTKIECFRRGSCHMTADSIDELHQMAERIGLRREWFQDHPLAPHYDLTPVKRHQVLCLGGVYKSAKDQARERIAKRQAAEVTP